VQRLHGGETLSYQGKFSKSEKVVLNVRPHEGRVPPVYVAVLARDAAYHVGRQKNRIFTVPYASCTDFADIGRMLDEYRKGRLEAGLPWTTTITCSRCTPTWRAATTRRALEAKDAYDLYVDTRLYAKKHSVRGHPRERHPPLRRGGDGRGKALRAARDGHPACRDPAQLRRPRSAAGGALDDAARARGDAGAGSVERPLVAALAGSARPSAGAPQSR
jgi:alkanesulfonate monooxygenase SsuD/methylene tetrahydromethanopterin reductase-like flavin-dependent oxidoreductase (luciferase family)